MSELQDGLRYRIVSFLQTETSVNYHSTDNTQVVRLRGNAKNWDFSRPKPNLCHLGIAYKYPYSGMSDDGKVIASTKGKNNSLWRITYRESDEAFTIGLEQDPQKVWTVAEVGNPDSEIVVREIMNIPKNPYFPTTIMPTQLFKFVPVHH